MSVAVKQRAHELIEALPDDATWQDLQYALELGAGVEAGLADATRRATRLHRTGFQAPRAGHGRAAA
jgi:hypothetical protein